MAQTLGKVWSGSQDARAQSALPGHQHCCPSGICTHTPAKAVMMVSNVNLGVKGSQQLSCFCPTNDITSRHTLKSLEQLNAVGIICGVKDRWIAIYEEVMLIYFKEFRRCFVGPTHLCCIFPCLKVQQRELVCQQHGQPGFAGLPAQQHRCLLGGLHLTIPKHGRLPYADPNCSNVFFRDITITTEATADNYTAPVHFKRVSLTTPRTPYRSCSKYPISSFLPGDTEGFLPGKGMSNSV